MNKLPLISIIIPVYNVESYLVQCLDSLVNQTYTNLEFICVNNGSTDTSLKILMKYAVEDSRFRVFSNPYGNQGPGAARNIGMSYARGKYIGFVDSDDWCALEMYERLVEVAEENNADFTISCAVPFLQKKNRYVKNSAFYNLDIFEEKEAKSLLSQTRLIQTQYFFGHFVCTRLFRRDFLERYDLAFREGIFYEDCFFSTELMFHVESFSFIKLPLYFYRRQRDGGITASKNIGKEDRLNFLQYYYQKLVEHNLSGEFINFWEYAFSFLDHFNDKEIYQKVRLFVLNSSISEEIRNMSFIIDEYYSAFKQNEDFLGYLKNLGKVGVIKKKLYRNHIEYRVLDCTFYKKIRKGEDYVSNS